VTVGARDPGRAAEAAAALGARAVPVGELSSVGEDLLLVTVTDGAIGQLATLLAGRPQAAVALHAAGAYGAELLAPLRGAGAAVGALHPLLPFPRPLPVGRARDAVFALDGDPPALELGRRLAAACGARAVEVPAAARLLYHGAATLAAAGVLTLCAAADEVAASQGLDPAVGRGYLRLAAGAVEAALAGAGAGAAITGPVARGEVDLVCRQLDGLAAIRPELADLVARLALETLRQLARAGRSSPAQDALRAALEARLGV